MKKLILIGLMLCAGGCIKFVLAPPYPKANHGELEMGGVYLPTADHANLTSVAIAPSSTAYHHDLLGFDFEQDTARATLDDSFALYQIAADEDRGRLWSDGCSTRECDASLCITTLRSCRHKTRPWRRIK